MLSILKTLSLFSGSRGPHGPELPLPAGENSTFHFKQSLSECRSCEHTHFDHLLRSATLHHFITMEYITSNKGRRKLAFENNIYIKQKVLSNGAVCWECKQRMTANTCKAKIHALNFSKFIDILKREQNLAQVHIAQARAGHQPEPQRRRY